MTAVDKAKELVDRFLEPIDGLHKYPMCFDTAKQSALICVDEMLGMSYSGYEYDSEIEVPFLEEVKQEISQL